MTSRRTVLASLAAAPFAALLPAASVGEIRRESWVTLRTPKPVMVASLYGLTNEQLAELQTNLDRMVFDPIHTYRAPRRVTWTPIDMKLKLRTFNAEGQTYLGFEAKPAYHVFHDSSGLTKGTAIFPADPVSAVQGALRKRGWRHLCSGRSSTTHEEKGGVGIDETIHHSWYSHDGLVEIPTELEVNPGPLAFCTRFKSQLLGTDPPILEQDYVFLTVSTV